MPGFSPCEAPILTLSTPGGRTRTRGLGFLGTQWGGSVHGGLGIGGDLSLPGLAHVTATLPVSQGRRQVQKNLYLSSLALVILRNTDSRHFSDTVILPILRFRFFFPLPPGSLACFSPVAWRCWWLEGAGEGGGRQERLVRAVGSWGGLRLASGAWSQVQRTRDLCCHTLRSAAREHLRGWGSVPKPCSQGLAHS